ncbi:phosphoenolpyruvate-protein phosphotransferase [Vibrio cholerae]|nr:phosphoenolpyruvate-protein phosphotransferase [Vibrio cholerae]
MALKQIQQTCATHQIPVCVCGELAGDPIGALLLIGLGYTTLSMNTSNVAKVKYLVRHSELAELTQLAEQALTQPYGREIYNMMLAYIEKHGFAGFVRAGKK